MCRWVFTKKKEVSRTVKIDFEAVEDVINNISAGKGQYPVSLPNYIEEHLQPNKQTVK